MPTVLIGLGSNIDPEENLRKAAAMLRKEFPNIRFSNVYRTAAREVTDQPDFLNAVATWNQEPGTSPEHILTILRHIEKALGKSPPFRFGPRTIDLDLLIYGDEILEDNLIVPHPRMHERRFVLEPLLELIDPTAEHPVLQKSWNELVDSVSEQKSAKTNLRL